jgi:hypothetical protein
MAGKRLFDTIGPSTAPTADEGRAVDVPAPRRPDVQASGAAAKPGRIAFTWRLTPDEANRIDALVLRMRSDLGVARLDRATVLAALCHLADANPAVYGAALGQVQEDA